MTDDDQPSNEPSPVDRPLTDEERNLMHTLAMWSLAEQTGVDAQAAADALDGLVEREGIVLQYDAYNANTRARDQHGPVIVHATREWWDWWAHLGQPLKRDDLLQFREQRPPRDDVN